MAFLFKLFNQHCELSINFCLFVYWHVKITQSGVSCGGRWKASNGSSCVIKVGEFLLRQGNYFLLKDSAR
jgi:hypothetical protein